MVRQASASPNELPEERNGGDHQDRQYNCQNDSGKASVGMFLVTFEQDQLESAG
jgi:hypothetical protein